MNMDVIRGILIPFLGTSLGAACVFFMRGKLNPMVQRALTGFAAGVMVAASVWSLLLPAIDQSAAMGPLAFLPAAAGFWLGVLFLLLLDKVVPHLHTGLDEEEGPRNTLARTTKLVLAVTIPVHSCSGSPHLNSSQPWYPSSSGWYARILSITSRIFISFSPFQFLKLMLCFSTSTVASTPKGMMQRGMPCPMFTLKTIGRSG